MSWPRRTRCSLTSDKASAPADALLVHETADEVKRGEVELMHVRSLHRRNDDADHPSSGLGAALLAGEEDGRQTPRARSLERLQHVRTPARGREAQDRKSTRLNS